MNNIKRAKLTISSIEVIYLHILLFFAWSNYLNWYPNDLKVLIYIGISAGFGGVLHCIRSMYFHYTNNDFKPEWLIWYIFRPILSTIMGVFVFFLVKGGLLVISSSNQNSNTEIYFFSGLAFIVGIHFGDVMDKLHKISGAIFDPQRPKVEKTNDEK